MTAGHYEGLSNVAELTLLHLKDRGNTSADYVARRLDCDGDTILDIMYDLDDRGLATYTVGMGWKLTEAGEEHTSDITRGDSTPDDIERSTEEIQSAIEGLQNYLGSNEETISDADAAEIRGQIRSLRWVLGDELPEKSPPKRCRE